jgi:hypothetical protein
MAPKKTLSERENELRSLLVTPAGRKELEGMASRYSVASGRSRAAGASVVTYILVHERVRGMISS